MRRLYESPLDETLSINPPACLQRQSIGVNTKMKKKLFNN